MTKRRKVYLPTTIPLYWKCQNCGTLHEYDARMGNRVRKYCDDACREEGILADRRREYARNKAQKEQTS